MNKYKCKECGKRISGQGWTGMCKSCWQIGEGNFWFGKKRKPFTKEHKENMSKSIKITLNRPEVKEKLKNLAIERYKDPKEREKISKSKIIHGLGNLPYSKEFTKFLRNKIRTRDNYKCQCCGMTQEENFNKYKKTLEVHHIDYYKFNCDENNLITLCKKCNVKANFDRDYWYAYFTYKMENKNE